MELLQSSAIGVLLRTATNNRVLRYPEEKEGFKIPSEYVLPSSSTTSSTTPDKARRRPEASDPEAGFEFLEDNGSDATRIEEGVTVVTWYSDIDPENPHNWTSRKKMYVSAVLFAYTFAAYIGSSLYTASVPAIRDKFGVNEDVANLGLALYVWGYGFAPMVLSPLTEIPAVGRNPPYAMTFSIFAILSVPMALADNVAGILVLRFLLGVFCSPALATVGASFSDFMSPEMMEYVIAFWGGGASLAPVSSLQRR